MRRLLCISLSLFAAVALAKAAPPVPLTIAQEGRLLDGQDQPAAGAHAFRIAIYRYAAPPAAGTGLADDSYWSKTYTGVQVDSSGAYSIDLSGKDDSGTELDTSIFPAGAQRFLGVSIDGGAEMVPRLAVGSVPYAFVAASAQALSCSGCVKPSMLAMGAGSGLDADTLDGLSASAFAPSSIEDSVSELVAAIGAPRTGETVLSDLATLSTALSAAQSAIDTDVKANGAALANDTSAIQSSIAGVDADVKAGTAALASDVSGAQSALAAQINALASQVGKSASGAPVGAMLDAISEMTAQLVAEGDHSWHDVGSLGTYANFQALLARYPLTIYQWGVDYNWGGRPLPVEINGWNGGVRITTALEMQGDGNSNPNGGFYLGGSAWFYGTAWNNGANDSNCTKSGNFYQYYWYLDGVQDPLTKFYSTNGCGSVPDVYVRRW